MSESFGWDVARRAMFGAAVSDPLAQALIRGPVEEPLGVLLLSRLEAHFFFLDGGDDVYEGLQAWVGVGGYGVLTQELIDISIESGVPTVFSRQFEAEVIPA